MGPTRFSTHTHAPGDTVLCGRHQGLPRLCLLLLVSACLPGCLGGPGVAAFVPLDLLFNVEEGRPFTIPGTPVFGEQTLVDDIPGKIGHHAATIAAFPDGELLAAWYSYDGPHELDGAAIYTARRPAGDAAWSSPQLHADRFGGDGNPVLYAEEDAVWLFQAVVPFGWSTAHIEVQRSSDRGGAWTPPVTLEGPMGSNVRNPPIRLLDGRLLLPAYDDLLLKSMFYTSADGDTWTLQYVVENEDESRQIQPSVVQLEGGRILALMRNSGSEWLWVMASDDAGGSWSRPSDSGFPNPASAATITRLTSGNIILAYNDSGTERRRLSVALSRDGGGTWPLRRGLPDDEHTRSYPSVIQSPDGSIHILYTLDRSAIRHVTVNEAWIAGG